MDYNDNWDKQWLDVLIKSGYSKITRLPDGNYLLEKDPEWRIKDE